MANTNFMKVASDGAGKALLDVATLSADQHYVLPAGGGTISIGNDVYLPDWTAGETVTGWALQTKPYIDKCVGMGGTAAQVVANVHGATAVATAYLGGVLSTNGRIYLTPYTQSTAVVWHYIDTATGSVVAYTHGATAVTTACVGGVLSPNGRIYLIPFSQSTAVVWHYIDTNCNGNWHKNLCTNPMFNKF